MATKIKKLTELQLEKKFASTKGWTLNKAKTEIAKIFHFDSYVDGLAFIARIAVHAEVLQHHPEITFSHEKVKVQLTTKEVKGLTQSDFDMVERIERISKQ